MAAAAAQPPPLRLLRAPSLLPSLQDKYAAAVEGVVRQGAEALLVVKLSAGRRADHEQLAATVRDELAGHGARWQEVDDARPWHRGLKFVTLFCVALEGKDFASASSCAHSIFHALNTAMLGVIVTAGLGTILDWKGLAAAGKKGVYYIRVKLIFRVQDNGVHAVVWEGARGCRQGASQLLRLDALLDGFWLLHCCEVNEVR